LFCVLGLIDFNLLFGNSHDNGWPYFLDTGETKSLYYNIYINQLLNNWYQDVINMCESDTFDLFIVNMRMPITTMSTLLQSD